MDNFVTLEALCHGKGLPTSSVGASKRTQILMERADVALQIKHCGVRPVTAISGTFENGSRFRVDALMLLQEPGIPEHLVAVLTPKNSPVVLFPVLQ